MRTLWDLTKGIAKIVEVLLGRINKLEEDVSSQGRRITGVENKSQPSIHSMEVKESDRRESEEARQDTLSDNALREELKTKYGTTKWAKNLISSIILGRRRKSGINH